MLRRLVSLLVLMAAPVNAEVTADQLRAMTEATDRQAVQRSQRANTGAVGTLLKDAGDSMQPPRSTKYIALPDAGAPIPRDPRPARVVDQGMSRGSAGAQDTQDGYYEPSSVYSPPMRSGASGDGVVDAVKPSMTFGIRLGSWLEASLRRNTTSADTGTVELVITNSFAGDRRSLPEGSLVFAEKQLNATTKRMEMRVTHGITPDGKEFDMQGLVFDPQKVIGLAGVYVLNRKEVVAGGVTKGAIAAVSAAVGQFGGNPVSGAATNAAAQSVLNDASQASQFNNSQQAVIYVSPQPLLIRVEKRF